MGGQESFIYSFVARGTMVLAEYTEFTGNFPAIAAQCLQRLPSSNNKFTYKCDHHIFNFLVEDGYAYCVVAKESVGKQISIALLERIKADFKKRYGGGKADTAVAKSLNKEFGPLMKEHMQYIIDHADEIEKLLKVKAQVSEVKSIMLENIDKTMERGEVLTSLNDKAEDLRNSAQEFKKQGQQLRRKMWYQNMKINVFSLRPVREFSANSLELDLRDYQQPRILVPLLLISCSLDDGGAMEEDVTCTMADIIAVTVCSTSYVKYTFFLSITEEIIEDTKMSTFTSTNIDESSSHAVVSYNDMSNTTLKNDGRIITIQLLMWDFQNLQKQKACGGEEIS
ncbi:UNVERIFIED_CONTAM: Vesicle-associated membrane protein [Sesamum radiatum]|uniref:Vesicle-associated membrane protein n=1 Tax=Sesamum radiatum TaxID=300843 RepID=A0AAW2UDN6_SESRA